MLKIALLAVLLAAGARGPREGRSSPAPSGPASRNTVVVVQVAAPAQVAVASTDEAPAVAADHPPCPASPLCSFNASANINDIPPRYSP